MIASHLIGLFQHEKFYFQTLSTILLGCRSNVLYIALLSTHEVCNSNTGQLNWLDYAKVHGASFARQWATDQMQTSEAVLTKMSQIDIGTFDTLPDFIFDLLGFAAMFVTGGKSTASHFAGAEVPALRPTHVLLEGLQSTLEGIPGRRGLKCANLIGMCIARWRSPDKQRALSTNESLSHAGSFEQTQPTTALSEPHAIRSLGEFDDSMPIHSNLPEYATPEFVFGLGAVDGIDMWAPLFEAFDGSTFDSPP
jgi:hypothetical protein